MSSDITEEFQLDLSSSKTTSTSSSAQTVAYDISIAGYGFHLANGPDEPYRRQTAQYRKDQNDNSSEPGEQTFATWWLRSQSSFHLGAGIKFYEPSQEQVYAQNQTIRFRYEDSQGVDVWEKGQASLLNTVISSDHFTVGNESECLRSIPQGVLLHDGYDLDKIAADGSVVHFVEYINPSTGLPYSGAEKVFAVCDNGIDAYWLTNGGGKWQIWKKPLSSTSPSTYTTGTTSGDATRVDQSPASDTVTYGHMEWVKERIVLAINNKLYEYTGAGTLSTTPIYTFNSTGTIVTSITASGSAVYVAFQNGIDSGILQLSLDTDTLSLTPIGITAEMPRNEIIQAIKYYLGYVAIGTSKGVRVAQVENNGSLIYGPLLFESDYPCYQFATSDRFVWAACGVGAYAGLVRVDLSTQMDTLMFPYANDLMAVEASAFVSRETTGVAFMGSTNLLAFTTPKTSTNGQIYIEDPETLVTDGYITTGRIRFNTLENKLYKFVTDSAAYDGSSSITISYIDKLNTAVELYTLSSTNGNRENNLTIDPQEFIQLKFTLTSSGTSSPALYGYQLKALPAAKRQRLIQYPVFNMDTQTDRYNNQLGYTGRAYTAIVELEQIEEDGDTISVTDYRTGETFNAMIEEISYTNETPPDRAGDNFGGKLLITVRKI